MTQNNINSILFQWSGHKSLESISTLELENLVLQNSFSPSLQLLLTKKYELEKQRQEMHCEYSGLPSVKAYEDVK